MLLHFREWDKITKYKPNNGYGRLDAARLKHLANTTIRVFLLCSPEQKQKGNYKEKKQRGNEKAQTEIVKFEASALNGILK